MEIDFNAVFFSTKESDAIKYQIHIKHLKRLYAYLQVTLPLIECHVRLIKKTEIKITINFNLIFVLIVQKILEIIKKCYIKSGNQYNAKAPCYNNYTQLI